MQLMSNLTLHANNSLDPDCMMQSGSNELFVKDLTI